MPKQMRNTSTIVAAQKHFICNCPLVKTSRDKKKLNGKEGMATMNEHRPLQQQQMPWRAPRQRFPRCKTTLQTPFLNPYPFQQWYGTKNIAKVRINGESCMVLMDNGAQINTIMLRYVSDHSLQVGANYQPQWAPKLPAWGWVTPTQDHWATLWSGFR